MLHDVGRERWLRKERGHALTRHTPFRTLSPLGCIQGVPWYSEQEQRVRPFLAPTTDDECATHPHPVLRLVYRGRRREFSRYLISLSLISNHLLPGGFAYIIKHCAVEVKKSNMTREQITIRLPTELMEQLRREAQERGMSFNDYLVALIQRARGKL